MWLVTRRRPLIFFGLPGAFLLTVGLAWGVWVVSIYVRSHTVIMGYALISVSLCIGGTLVLCTGAILYSIQELVTTMGQSGEKATYKPQAADGGSQLVSRYWPLFIFALPGGFLLLAGMAAGVRVVSVYSQTHVFSMGYALLTTLLSITGSLWLIAGILLHSVRELVLRKAEA
jgi:hypothetical protein